MSLILIDHVCYSDEEEEVDVQCIDYGTSECVPLEDVRIGQQASLGQHQPVKIIHCKLFGVQPVSQSILIYHCMLYFTQIIVKAFAQMFRQQHLLYYISSNLTTLCLHKICNEIRYSYSILY